MILTYISSSCASSSRRESRSYCGRDAARDSRLSTDLHQHCGQSAEDGRSPTLVWWRRLPTEPCAPGLAVAVAGVVAAGGVRDWDGSGEICSALHPPATPQSCSTQSGSRCSTPGLTPLLLARKYQCEYPVTPSQPCNAMSE